MLEPLRVFLFDNVKQFILEEKLVSFFDHCEVEWLHVTGWRKAYNLNLLYDSRHESPLQERQKGWKGISTNYREKIN